MNKESWVAEEVIKFVGKQKPLFHCCEKGVLIIGDFISLLRWA
jgi:hypothetical protein